MCIRDRKLGYKIRKGKQSNQTRNYKISQDNFINQSGAESNCLRKPCKNMGETDNFKYTKGVKQGDKGIVP